METKEVIVREGQLFLRYDCGTESHVYCYSLIYYAATRHSNKAGARKFCYPGKVDKEC